MADISEKIARRIWEYCEVCDWGNGGSMLCYADFERIVREELNIPIDKVLFCPKCQKQHIDKPEPSVCQECGANDLDHQTGEDNGTCPEFTAWLNPPHKSHRCHFCNHVWRPFEFATNGVLLKDKSPVEIKPNQLGD